MMSQFASKKKGHALQPDELSRIADWIIIYEALNGKPPKKEELIKMWEDDKDG